MSHAPQALGERKHQVADGAVIEGVHEHCQSEFAGAIARVDDGRVFSGGR
jgi:hypothetical protein